MHGDNVMIHGTSVPENSILLTDWYQISMGDLYHRLARFNDDDPRNLATFEVFIRKFPKGRKAMKMDYLVKHTEAIYAPV